MTQPDASTEELSEALVNAFMAVIGAPDDEAVARHGDEVLTALDERLRSAAAPPAAQP
ncbi:hypothetical protein [Frankia sp. EAN1pec]|uniref:hypothetical protein n=1 Tax=Parafrankia sp. (strain EAN1pec) TaxID=298653 RepID=UPI0002D2C15A